MTVMVRLNLDDRKRPSFMAVAHLARVPVADDVIEHEGISYIVDTVVLAHGENAHVVAKAPLWWSVNQWRTFR